MRPFPVSNSPTREANPPTRQATSLTRDADTGSPAAKSPIRSGKFDSREANSHSRGADNENVVMQIHANGGAGGKRGFRSGRGSTDVAFCKTRDVRRALIRHSSTSSCIDSKKP